MYETFARSSWGLALLIQIVSCQCGLGGKGWAGFSEQQSTINIPHDVNQRAIIVRICSFQREIKLKFAITQYSHFPGIINKVLSWKM